MLIPTPLWRIPISVSATTPEKKPKSRLWKLEGVRGFAALYVLIHHLSHPLIGQSGLKALPFRFGQEAVIVFFLISGFVIEYSAGRTPQSELRFGDYFRRRAWRIYPLFLAALLLSYLMQCWAQGGLAPLMGTTLLGNLFMVQSITFMIPGTWVVPYQGNAPLWSLSFEWWFYMAYFPIRKYVPDPMRKAVVFGLALVGVGSFVLWHNPISVIASYFGIWWAGVELAREYADTKRITLGRQWLHWASVTTIMLLWALIAWREPVRATVGHYPLIQIRHFGSALVMLAGAFVWYRLRWIGFQRLLGPFVRLAPYSYGIYVMHDAVVGSPLLELFPSRALGGVVTFAAALAVGVASEWAAVRYLPTGKKSPRRPAPEPLPAPGA